MKNIYILIITIFLLSSCGGLKDAGKVLRNEKITTTDEFLVKKKRPLVLPPDYQKLPKPGEIKNKDGKFSNKKLMFTGGFKNISRSEAKAIVETNGGKVLGSISKKLDILVVGDSKPTKKKIEQAKQLKIKIILEKEWNKILNS